MQKTKADGKNIRRDINHTREWSKKPHELRLCFLRFYRLNTRTSLELNDCQWMCQGEQKINKNCKLSHIARSHVTERFLTSTFCKQLENEENVNWKENASQLELSGFVCFGKLETEGKFGFPKGNEIELDLKFLLNSNFPLRCSILSNEVETIPHFPLQWNSKLPHSWKCWNRRRQTWNAG